MILDPLLDFFRGKAVTIPPMDGALRPNTALDDADVVAEADTPDNLCESGGRALYSSGGDVFAVGEREPVAHYEKEVAALASSPSGATAAALLDGRIAIGESIVAPPNGLACPTAIAFAGDSTLIVCHGSERHGANDWALDLMEKNASGSVWKIDLTNGKEACLARGLAYPNGILVRGSDIIVSESWRHRLVRIPHNGGSLEPILSQLPAYPARLAPARDGGGWLALFAPRNRLIEFILLEDDYRAAMLRDIPRDSWIAPALSSGRSFLEPLQCGAVRTMGIHKPWSPTRSYGLVTKLDRDLRPVASFHSRANGKRHGVTSIIEIKDGIFATAKGGGMILRIAGEAPR